MVTNTLVELPREVREAGWNLREALHKAQFPFTAMFWAEFLEDNWRIFLATPLPDEQRPEDPYRWLRTILYTLSEDDREALALSDIVIVRPEARIVSEVRRRYGVVQGDRRTTRRFLLSPNEAYVYELREPDAGQKNPEKTLAGAAA